MTDAQIKTVVSANTADFEKGLLRMSRQLNNFEKQQRATNQKVESGFAFMSTAASRFVGVLSVGLVANYANRLLDMAGNLKDLSLQSGIAASTLSALKSQLEQGGSSVDEFSSSITKMNRAIAEASLGDNKGLIDSFNRIKLSIKNLQQLSPEQQFFEIARALSQVTDIGEQTRIGFDIFGRSFSSLLPIIKDTNGELANYVEKMQQAGTALTEDQIKRLDDFGDAMTRASNDLSNALAGGFADFLKFFDEFEAKSAGFDAIYNPAIERVLQEANRKKLQAERIANGLAVNTGNKPKSVTEPRPFLPSDFIGPPIPSNNKVEQINRIRKDSDLAAKSAENLSEALSKMQREAARENYTSGMDDLQKKLATIDFIAADLEKQYKTKMTEIDKKRVESIKEMTTELHKYNEEQEDAKKIADELGGAFRDAFADAVLGAEDLSDVLGALSKRLQQIAFNKFVGDPLSKAADRLFGKIGSSVFDALPTISVATGIKNVPYDMTARLHKGEQVITRQGVDSMQRNSISSGSSGNIYNIDARGADQGAVARLERSLIALAGPGVIERRVLNAQTRGTL